MNVLGALDEANCKAFSIMLKGSAKDWYLSIPQDSVCNFSQPGKMFLGRFRAYQAIMNTPIGLMSVKHAHVVTLNTKFLEDQWAIDAFIVRV